MRLFEKLILTLLTLLTIFGCSPNARNPNSSAEDYASTTAAVTPAPAYPLRVSSNARYLEDQNGTPFLWVGESVWAAASRRANA